MDIIPSLPDERDYTLETLLAAIQNSLNNGSYMTGGNYAFVLLCDKLRVNDDDLVFRFDPKWAVNAAI